MDKKESFVFRYHNNDPVVTTATILNETKKAFQISIQHIDKPVWVPKNALTSSQGIVTMKRWFKDSISSNRYAKIALGVMAQ